MSEQKRMPFGQEYEPKQGPVKGLKIQSDRSKFTQQTEQRHQFEEQADAFMEKKRDRNKQALDLAKRYMSLVKDKTLEENKTHISKDVENEVIDNLITLSLDINDDETERNGMGSIALINLLLKTILAQRDMINNLDYKASQLSKQLSSLQERSGNDHKSQK